MALKIEYGDLFNAVMDTKCILVHGCNAQGIMGSGVAALVRKLYPFAYDTYKERKKGTYKLGEVIVAASDDSPVVVANAITQEFYGRDGKLYVSYDAVVDAAHGVRAVSQTLNLPVHLPLVGGGLGGGDEKRLTAIFQAVFHDVDATLWLQEN